MLDRKVPADGKFNFCFVFVLQVATQGYSIASGGKVQKKDKCWVESYTLSFSTDGSRWQQYTENGAVKVFYKLLCIRSAYTFTAYLTIRPNNNNNTLFTLVQLIYI